VPLSSSSTIGRRYIYPRPIVFRTKLVRAEPLIVAAIQAQPDRVYTRSEIAGHHLKLRRDGVLAKHTKLDEFLNFLIARRHLMAIKLEAKEYAKETMRYFVGRPSSFAIAASLRKNGFMSHGTAAYLHGLIKEVPNTIYLNVELSAKPAPDGALS
jgi:hypothetical protein